MITTPVGVALITQNLAGFLDSFVGDNCRYFPFPNIVEHLFSHLGRGFIKFIFDKKKC